MKAFSFPLEKVLQWRRTQLDLQKSRIAAAGARVSGIKKTIDAQTAEAAEAAARIAREPASVDFQAYSGFLGANRARLGKLQEQLTAAQRACAIEMNRLVEANRKLRPLENLKADGQSQWQREFDRDLAAFADEAFLAGLQSKKRTGA